MYLKALELQGFKSFPEKTRITFERSVTAIVGPNGSGKSNISDALLWVMGEQRTRALRGGKMEDVIFGGTEKRSPMGFAQVTLTLDNSEHTFDRDSDEVTIARRCYRSGESEYYINKEPVRLKDVTELLMDTGLGRDGYSVIGQGRIAEIVSARSTDRREIFEEAAGISRFRYRKEESERKLARTEENLVRIGDKIAELELQVEPLRQQSETARQYLLLRDELRLKEISLWMENLDRLQDRSSGLCAQCEEAAAARETAKAELETLYAESESLTEELRANELEIERVRERQRSEEAGAAELESSAAVLRTNIQNNDDTVTRLERELSEQRGRADSLQGQIEGYTARLEELRIQLAALEEESADFRSSAAVAEDEARERSDALNALLLRESGSNAALAEKTAAETLRREELHDFEERKNSLAGVLSEAEQAVLDFEEALKTEQRSLSAAGEQVTRTANMITGRAQLLANRERDCVGLSEQREELRGTLRAMESRISLLRELEREYEGFSKAVRTVMQESDRGTLRGIHGPVARLITTEDRYALAVETALGGSAQHIVVEDQRAGKAAIELLRRRSAGRDTFLPLDVIRPSDFRRDLRGEDGFVAVASELVRCEERYRDIMSYLLGRTVICEDLDSAVRLGNKYKNSLRIVTLDGQMINAGGSMTGGSSGRDTGILSRANELQRLSGQYADTETELRNTEENARKAEQKRLTAANELENAREDNVSAREEQRRLEGSCQRAELLLSASRERLAALAEERDSLSRRRAECEDKLNALIHEKTALLAELASLRQSIERENRDGGELESRRRAIEEQLSGYREKRAALESERESAERAVRQLAELREDMLRQSGGAETMLSEARTRGESWRGELTALEGQQAARRLLIETIQAEAAELSRKRLETEGRRVTAEKAAQEKNRSLLELERSCAALEQKRQAADLEENQIVDRLWETYELSRSAAMALRQPIESYSRVSREVTDLRKRIGALGNPNLGAIEEYQRVSERYNFLTEQRSDVERSKTEIQSILRDITTEMETIFRRRFQEIDTAFRETFLQLFGGGKAALSLEDENNVLECGIDIRIQPPGKALSNISLLSGGEKSFVAIALYFAIMKVRPTPFCVMDEIESALDEANVGLFADYLHTMAGKTQFIVITHRRGSMESADALYGVTMQEKGVSTVLSVDMDEALNSVTA